MSNAKLRPVEYADDRSAARTRLLVEATTEVRSNISVTIVKNISTTGLMVEASRALPSGSLITVDLHGVGSKDVRIVWNNGRYQGGEFLHPLSPSQLGAASRHSKVVWPTFTSDPFAAHQRGAEQHEVVGGGKAVDQGPVARLAPGLKLQIVALLSMSIWALIWSAA